MTDFESRKLINSQLTTLYVTITFSKLALDKQAYVPKVQFTLYNFFFMTCSDLKMQ